MKFFKEVKEQFDRIEEILENGGLSPEEKMRYEDMKNVLGWVLGYYTSKPEEL